MAETNSDFKFGTQFGFENLAHRKITGRKLEKDNGTKLLLIAGY